jgi:hypothetical protein
MSTLLEITELANGDVVLREADTESNDQTEPLVRIRFSGEVRDMLGKDLVSVAEAMIDAATEFLESDAEEVDDLVDDDTPPIIH